MEDGAPPEEHAEPGAAKRSHESSNDSAGLAEGASSTGNASNAGNSANAKGESQQQPPQPQHMEPGSVNDSQTSSGSKGKKRERLGGESGDPHSNKVRFSKDISKAIDDAVSLGLIEKEFRKACARNGGLKDEASLNHFLSTIRAIGSPGNDLSPQHLLLKRLAISAVIVATEEPKCLQRIVESDVLRYLVQWLQESHPKAKKPAADLDKDADSKGVSDIEESLDGLILMILRALHHLPVDLKALKDFGVGKIVKQFKSYPNAFVQKRARRLVDEWKRKVDETMAKSKPDPDTGEREDSPASASKRNGSPAESTHAQETAQNQRTDDSKVAVKKKKDRGLASEISGYEMEEGELVEDQEKKDKTNDSVSTESNKTSSEHPSVEAETSAHVVETDRTERKSAENEASHDIEMKHVETEDGEIVEVKAGEGDRSEMQSSQPPENVRDSNSKDGAVNADGFASNTVDIGAPPVEESKGNSETKGKVAEDIKEHDKAIESEKMPSIHPSSSPIQSKPPPYLSNKSTLNPDFTEKPASVSDEERKKLNDAAEPIAVVSLDLSLKGESSVSDTKDRMGKPSLSPWKSTSAMCVWDQISMISMNNEVDDPLLTQSKISQPSLGKEEEKGEGSKNGGQRFSDVVSDAIEDEPMEDRETAEGASTLGTTEADAATLKDHESDPVAASPPSEHIPEAPAEINEEKGNKNRESEGRKEEQAEMNLNLQGLDTEVNVPKEEGPFTEIVEQKNLIDVNEANLAPEANAHPLPTTNTHSSSEVVSDTETVQNASTLGPILTLVTSSPVSSTSYLKPDVKDEPPIPVATLSSKSVRGETGLVMDLDMNEEGKMEDGMETLDESGRIAENEKDGFTKPIAEKDEEMNDVAVETSEKTVSESVAKDETGFKRWETAIEKNESENEERKKGKDSEEQERQNELKDLESDGKEKEKDIVESKEGEGELEETEREEAEEISEELVSEPAKETRPSFRPFSLDINGSAMTSSPLTLSSFPSVSASVSSLSPLSSSSSSASSTTTSLSLSFQSPPPPTVYFNLSAFSTIPSSSPSHPISYPNSFHISSPFNSNSNSHAPSSPSPPSPPTDIDKKSTPRKRKGDRSRSNSSQSSQEKKGNEVRKVRGEEDRLSSKPAKDHRVGFDLNFGIPEDMESGLDHAGAELSEEDIPLAKRWCVSDASEKPKPAPRPLLNIDLNVAGMMEESQPSQEISRKPETASGYIRQPTTNRIPSDGGSLRLDLDLNRSDDGEDGSVPSPQVGDSEIVKKTWNSSHKSGEKSSKRVVRDFDLNDGPLLDDSNAPAQPSSLSESISEPQIQTVASLMRASLERDGSFISNATNNKPLPILPTLLPSIHPSSHPSPNLSPLQQVAVSFLPHGIPSTPPPPYQASGFNMVQSVGFRSVAEGDNGIHRGEASPGVALHQSLLGSGSLNSPFLGRNSLNSPLLARSSADAAFSSSGNSKPPDSTPGFYSPLNILRTPLNMPMAMNGGNAPRPLHVPRGRPELDLNSGPELGRETLEPWYLGEERRSLQGISLSNVADFNALTGGSVAEIVLGGNMATGAQRVLTTNANLKRKENEPAKDSLNLFKGRQQPNWR